MLLGHWYLVQPGLSREPGEGARRRCTSTSGRSRSSRCSCRPGMVGVLSGTVDDGYGGLLGWIWVVSALTTIVLVCVTWLALREQYYSAVMAATGLLYLAILTAFGTDLVARAAAARRRSELGRRERSIGVRSTKYFASGWGTMIAEVLCSGTSWNSSVRATPICRSRAARRASPGPRGPGTRGSPTSTASRGTAGGTARRATGRPRRRSPTPRGCGGATARRALRSSRPRARAVNRYSWYLSAANSSCSRSDARSPTVTTWNAA